MSHTKQQRVDEAVRVETAEGDIGPWRRWAPMICVGIVAVGTTLGSPWVVWGAAVTALTGAALPHHPVDYFYNHIVRRFTGTGPLPPNTPERKVACLMVGFYDLGQPCQACCRRAVPSPGVVDLVNHGSVRALPKPGIDVGGYHRRKER
jgi:hypothetical protein